MRLCTKLGSRDKRAFTMVEIALSLAVVAFALVAIMGVLPTGMTVQKDNREDTIINQEGRFWIEAIKGGAVGVTELTNYVEEITITNAGAQSLILLNNQSQPLTSRDIIAILSTPRPIIATNTFTTARVKALTGPAAEKGPLTNEYSFRYQLRAEVMPTYPIPPAFIASTGNTNLLNYNEMVGENLWEVRLQLRWPVVERGNGWYIGHNRKTFRARIAGRRVPVATNDVSSFLRKHSWEVIVPNRFYNHLRPNG